LLHTQVNNVLKVLDFPDNQEKDFRKILEKQDSTTLKDLATKSQEDILMFLVTEKQKIATVEKSDMSKVESEETAKQNTETQRINQQIAKIKSAFPTDILNAHPDIANKLNSLDTITDPSEKNKVLKEILATLKNP